MLESLFAPESRSLEDPNTPLTGQNLAEYFDTNIGIQVDNQSALTLSAVYSCIYVLSSSIGQLPLHVMRKRGDKIEAAKDHPAYWRHDPRPCPGLRWSDRQEPDPATR